MTSLDVSHFNTTNVGMMYGMFGKCSSLTELDLTSFNVEKCGNFYEMFEDCKNLTVLLDSNGENFEQFTIVIPDYVTISNKTLF